jgi:CRISPR/Cas system-associated exonuclease Cas4 (RecB family)
MSDRNEGHDLPHTSISQVTMWQRCPKQYEYRYVLGLKRPPTPAMASGSSIHAGLEANNRVRIETGEDMPMEALLAHVSDVHDKVMQDTAPEKEPGEKGRFKDENIEIARFYRRVQAPHIEPVRAEHTFTIQVPPDEQGEYLPVIGYIDVEAVVPDPELGPMAPKVRSLEDYKRVTRNRKTQADADLSLQLTLYDYSTSLTGQRLPDVIGLRNLGFNGLKTRATEGPGPYTAPVYRSALLMEPARRRRKWERALGTVRKVQGLVTTGLFPPTDDPKTCSWCGYLDICQETPLKNA